MADEPEVLSRDEFREGVFKRDGHKCLICGAPAKDAHHIIERRLFDNGGYYLDNGASVCEKHHIEAEQTLISCEELREKAGIKTVVLPDHLYGDQRYDKWGNPILPNGQRFRGELFHDPSVQKILQPVLHLFTDKVKYPRTYHLPWSPGVTKDDRVMEDLYDLGGEPLIATIKMDGEQTTMYRDYVHARSLEWHPHPSRTWVKNLHAKIGHEIPVGWRVCGENLWAKHSIKYSNLEDYFQVFSVWDDENKCLSWKETEEWANLLGLKTVPVWRTIAAREAFYGITPPKIWEGDEVEGFVLRVARSFHYGEFRTVVGKYVRAGHVQTHGHWMRQAIEKNELKKEAT